MKKNKFPYPLPEEWTKNACTVKQLIKHLKQFDQDSPVTYSVFGIDGNPNRKDFDVKLNMIRQCQLNGLVHIMIDI